MANLSGGSRERKPLAFPAFADRLREAGAPLGLTEAADFASACGVSHKQAKRWLAGTHHPNRMADWRRVADALGVTVGWLKGLSEGQRQPTAYGGSQTRTQLALRLKQAEALIADVRRLLEAEPESGDNTHPGVPVRAASELLGPRRRRTSGDHG